MAGLPIDVAVSSFERSLRARNLSPRTVNTYLEAADGFRAWLAENDGTDDLEQISRAHVQGYLVSLQDAGRKPTTVSVRYRSLQQFFKWAVDEEELFVDVMAKMRPPTVPEILVPLLSIEDITKLLKVCEGKGFVERRDTAMIRLFLDSGLRLAEMAGVDVDDVDFNTNVVSVMGKGRKARDCPFGHRTAVHLDRYVRIRSRSPQAQRSELWLGEKGKGPMTPNGIGQLVRRRAAQAGLKGLHPHMFRHTWVDAWLDSDGTEGDLQRLAGWESSQMIERYARINAGRRARNAARSRSFGDKF